jgi:hypothetical protein
LHFVDFLGIPIKLNKNRQYRDRIEELTQTLSAEALAKAEIHREEQRFTEKIEK